MNNGGVMEVCPNWGNEDDLCHKCDRAGYCIDGVIDYPVKSEFLQQEKWKRTQRNKRIFYKSLPLTALREY